MSLSFEDYQDHTVLCEENGSGGSRSPAVTELPVLPEILRDNKNACRFALSDADAALNMAAFVRRQLNGQRTGAGISPALLALALMQSPMLAPDQ